MEFFKKLMNIKLVIKPPKTKKVLVYDSSNIQVFENLLNKKDYNIFFNRYEELNLFILKNAIFIFIKKIFKFKSSSLSSIYVYEFIKASNPKLVITLVDNKLSYFLLKKRFPKIKFFLIQNGNSLIDFKEILSQNKKELFIDKLMTFNKIYAKEFSKYVKGKKIIIGSIKNNFVKIKKYKTIKVLFVSQFRKFRKHKKEVYVTSQDKKKYTWEDFYQYEKKIIKLLAKFCINNDYKLSIAGFYENKHGAAEKNFYNEQLIHFPNLKWEVYNRIDIYSAYKLIDRSSLVVFIDSALGYETLMRNTKCVSFSVRKIKGRNFGWPKKLNQEGPFWINYFDETKCLKKLNHISQISQNHWKKLKNKYIKDLIFYNYKNTELSKIINKEIKK